MDRAAIPGFEALRVQTPSGTWHAERAGTGHPVVLLHGFPETSLMWRGVAPLLATRFDVIAFDLPGYGRSDVPRDRGMSKREIAAMIHDAMTSLGISRYSIVGHDRGARVAYRAALDRPGAVDAIAVLDILPTAEVWDRADDRLALAFWPFSLLAQPAPLPERLIAAAPEAVVTDALDAWGSAASAFPDEVRASYIEALRDPDHIHAICEEYRAAATVDRRLDEEDRASGHLIEPRVLCLWSGAGALESWYADAGGPLGIWRRWARTVEGHAVEGGHFFPEEHPRATARLLGDFLAG